MKSYGIYAHVPFCKAKCFYCDFSSWPGNESQFEPYFNALEKEINGASSGLNISSIFIGGGTPSLVDSKHIHKIMNAISKKYYIEKDAEISIESNPGTLCLEKLRDYRSFGINRLSMGLQSTQDRLLKEIGRIHSFNEFEKNYEDALKSGFDNINIDLMFALPNQTLTDWVETLTKITAINPKHISAYSLKIEEGTRFGTLYKEGKITECEDELDREMYHTAIDMLSAKGYEHYEISNFAKQDFECRHNLLYWEAKEYLGFGASAHSYFEGTRYSNCSSISDYIKSVNSNTLEKEEETKINQEESMSETMILGLRLMRGVDIYDFKRRYNVDIFDVYKDKILKLEKAGLIQVTSESIKLSPIGIDLANQIMIEFI